MDLYSRLGMKDVVLKTSFRYALTLGGEEEGVGRPPLLPDVRSTPEYSRPSSKRG